MGDGGTEEFPNLGKHCQHSDCYQLDFLPFNCDGCRQTFCLEHRSYKSHECPKGYPNSRKVMICEICSTAIEITGKDEEEVKKISERHEKSEDCDPSKKKKPRCPVRRCKQVLTFSNTCTCKVCQIKFCLDHRFPTDHACKGSVSSEVVSGGGRDAIGNKFLMALVGRNSKDCGGSMSSPSSNKSSRIPSVKAC
ncbi:Zinc finger an1 domain-containing stress-associated protein [Thalictrum thalictroides]|uniref:Zinc finger an1 domain-containing stress-associated protein n=1 Tax=Thalictrum thalictroides TaxID=46969 RepID=A0A7J6VMW0_THATH|nr:Zinc finger an1 domain-containing stress-associated protein [Thalictrum thalictroides]